MVRKSLENISINALSIRKNIGEEFKKHTPPQLPITEEVDLFTRKEAAHFLILTINCDAIAKLGGSLHCISFTN